MANQGFLIGAHVRTAGGLGRAVRYAASVGCEIIQLFAKSPVQWDGPRHTPAQIAEFRDALTQTGISLVATHASYLLNLASPDDDLWERSVTALIDEVMRAEALNAPTVVTHLGSTQRPRDEACGRVAEALARALEATSDRSAVRIAIENSAGAGMTVGSTPEELCAVLDRVPDPFRERVDICIDTCHAHVAGHDLSTPSGWHALVDPIVAGGTRITVVHANDALFGASSHRDRHAWIGDGTIGADGFAALFTMQQLRGADVIVEMPGMPPENDAINVERLKRLRDRASQT